MHRGEICPRGNLESDHLALQECSNSKEQLLFLATWHWRQRHYNPSESRELLAHQQSITILQTGIYSIWDSCWPRILRSLVWDVTVWKVQMSEGRNRLHLHGQPSLHTIIPQQTVTHAIQTTLPVLFNAWFILIIVCLCLPAVITLLHGFTCFCTQCWDTLIINKCPCIFSTPL